MPQRVTLTLQNGIAAGLTAEVTESPFTVGRLSENHFPINDIRMSGRHFQLVLQDDTVSLHDLKSRNGVLVNGQPAARVELASGDVIQVGDSQILVEIYADAAASDQAGPAKAAAPRVAAPVREPLVWDTLRIYHLGELADEDGPETPPKPEIAAPNADRDQPWRFSLQPNRVWQHPQQWVYAIIDAAQGVELVFEAKVAGADPVSLVLGELARDLLDAAPYLVPLSAGSPFWHAWTAAYGKNAGVLLDAPVAPAELFVHLHSQFEEVDFEGNEFYFRFYDPRVLRDHLEKLSSKERQQFFGPIRQWIVEAADGAGYVAFTLDGEGGLRTEKLGLLEPVPGVLVEI